MTQQVTAENSDCRVYTEGDISSSAGVPLPPPHDTLQSTKLKNNLFTRIVQTKEPYAGIFKDLKLKRKSSKRGTLRKKPTARHSSKSFNGSFS